MKKHERSNNSLHTEMIAATINATVDDYDESNSVN